MYRVDMFDILNFPFPMGGVNQAFSAHTLDFNYAYWLENIIPYPAGEGRVRYGTKKVSSVDLATGTEIIKIFPYTTIHGVEQSLLYTYVFEEDTDATNKRTDKKDTIFFQSSNIAKYLIGSKVLIEYRVLGGEAPDIHYTLVAEIASRTIEGDSEIADISLKIKKNFFVSDEEVHIVVDTIKFQTGKIYKYEADHFILLKDDLAVNVIPRSTFFSNYLILCNGINRILSWDGENLKEIYDYLQEKDALNFIKVSDTEFTFNVGSSFQIKNYESNVIQLHIAGQKTSLEVRQVTFASSVVTITTASRLPQFGDQMMIFFRKYPPNFSFIAVLHNRLWGVKLANGIESMYAYYARQTASLEQWFDETTQEVRFLDLSSKQGTVDVLEYIGIVYDKIVFIGRKCTQVWSGFDPIFADSDNALQWSATLEGGVINADLCLNIYHNLWVVSERGIMSLTSSNITRQLEFTAAHVINNIANNHIINALNDPEDYRVCTSFAYPEGGFIGFKIGRNETLIGFIQTNIVSWSIFSGDFTKASAFATFPKKLYLTINNALYLYGDGISPTYSDSGVNIYFSWVLPRASMNGYRYAGKRYRIEVIYPYSFLLKTYNYFGLSLFGDLSQTFNLTAIGKPIARGDLLDNAPLGLTSDTQDGLRLDIPYAPFTGRFKFVASTFWLRLDGLTSVGPVTIKKIIIYGTRDFSSQSPVQ